MTTISSTEAKLKTLNVTIQALAVNGKQMTLAVFRQLPIGPIQNDRRELLPEIRLWGLVRYNIKDEGDLWVVFDKDGILYRSRFPMPYSEVRLAERSIEQWERILREADQMVDSRIVAKDMYLLFDTTSDYAKPTLSFYPNIHNHIHPQNIKVSERHKILGKYLEDAKVQLSKAITENDTNEAVRKTLAGLPQLFIAV